MPNDKHFKWIEIRTGVFKTVPLTDDRPEVNLPNKKGIPAIITKVPWASLEDAVHSEDPHTQRKATDEFLKERAKWTKTSEKYRKWEEQRKGEWVKQKPAWRKKMMKEGKI